MIEDAFLESMKKEFPFEMTEKQEDVSKLLFLFLISKDPQSVFLLRGYAGTGKTILVAALVRVLHKLKKEVVLLAPTGRAAKVFSVNAGFIAYTIHKQIYRQRSLMSENSHFDLDKNKSRSALFIVDESSMVSVRQDERSIFGSGFLLRDLLKYVYSVSGCQILFVGDDAQLPPVGDEESPALMPSFFKKQGYNVWEFQLKDVMRQEKKSGILANATNLRTLLSKGRTNSLPRITFSCFTDIIKMHGNEVIEKLQQSYEKVGTDQTIVLTRSNKQANVYNEGIRSTFFGREELLTRGDIVMIVRNNYFWTEQLSLKLATEKSKEKVPMNFIANGDIAEVLCVSDYLEFYGLHFADVRLRFPDYDNFEMKVRVLLDVLHSEGPMLSVEKNKQLFNGVLEDYADEYDKRKRMKKVQMDPNFNALQLKYAYAVTCHKAQGGQWSNVFIDQGWLPSESVDINYYRWLYTAFTRATKHLYLVNWPDKQNAEL